MPIPPRRGEPSAAHSTRRRLLLGSLAAGWGLIAVGRAGADDAKEQADIEALARKAGLPPFRSSRTEHYFGIGDAPDAYREQALRIGKALATAFQKHFRGKGFDVALPTHRLTVVALAGPDSYAAYLGEDPGQAVGGHYDLDTNRLVIFDFRPGATNLAADPERVNTLTLIHEATHQLTFNTGLLDRPGDVPLCLSEGLAMYGELWRPAGRPPLGSINTPRLQALAQARDQAAAWIPIDRLLSDDEPLRAEATRQQAYAQSWLWVHAMLTDRASIPRFRAYLDAIRPRREPEHRLDDAMRHLGNLERLDRTLQQAARRLIRA